MQVVEVDLKPTGAYAPEDLMVLNQYTQEDTFKQKFQNSLADSIEISPELPAESVSYSSTGMGDPKSGYPTEPAMKLLTPEKMRKFDTYLVFYVYYYFNGTQYMFYAAKELRRRGWRLCGENKLWMRRKGVAVEGDGYEIGNYECFMYNESNYWEIKTLEGFKFNNSDEIL